MINEVKLIQLFCEIDDFAHVYEQKLAGHLLPVNSNSKHSTHKPGISLSGMMTLEILYHLSGYKCFEYFYQQEVLQGSLHTYFPHAPSYNRFVELKPRMLVALICYLHCLRLGTLLGLYYADSPKDPADTALKVCHNRRIHCHQVFRATAKRGQSSTGWFYGFKLFLVVNGLGELVQAFVTPANVADNALANLKRLFKGLTGLAFADKGFASPQKAFPILYHRD